MRTVKAALAAIVVLMLWFPSRVDAQVIDFNGNVVAGASYRVDPTDSEPNRTRFFLTANITGIGIGVPNLYFGGVGVNVPDVLSGSPGLGLSVPILSYYFSGGQALVQAGYSYDLSGDPKTQGIYAGLGWGFTSPNRIAAKRAEKAKKKTAELVRLLELQRQARREAVRP